MRRSLLPRGLNLIVAALAAASGACGEAGRGLGAQHRSPLDGVVGNAEAGEELFSLPIPTGNDRSCATCHRPERAFTLTPALVAQEFERAPDGPLFRSVDADDDGNDFSTLRRLALARVEIPLHPAVRDAAQPDLATARLFRSVPSIWNVALTAPYLSDGRAATLQEQAAGAIVTHIQPQVDAFDATQIEHLVAFERAQFSSDLVRAVAEALGGGESPPPAIPPLDALEQQGQLIFDARCLRCHGGARGDEPRNGIKFTDVLVSRTNRAGLPARQWAFTGADGSVQILSSPDPGRALLTGNVADFERFEIPQLRGVSHTAPYFHDNGAATLEDVLEQYNVFFAAQGRPLLTPDERVALVAYLKAI